MIDSEFKFIGYRITDINCLIKDDFGKVQEKLSQDINVENKFSTDDKRFVEVVLSISVKTESDNFSFYLKMKGAFKASDGMPDDLFTKLSVSNAPAILFPFARAIITSYTAQANIPPIILPTVNFTESSK